MYATQYAYRQGKVNMIRRLKYISPGLVKSEIEVFHVAKGEDDIRLVYNGTSCGLNAVLWAPWFAVPTVNTLLRTVETGTFMGDGDIGDQFHNFMLHPSLQSFVGVDFRVFPQDPGDKETTSLSHHQEHWERLCMGLRPSPYMATQSQHRAEERVLCPSQAVLSTLPHNPFEWDAIQDNCPGNEDYNPQRPWLFLCRKDGSLALALYTYIDDQRVTGPDHNLCWLGLQHVGSTMSYLGIQIASRKRRDVGMDNGAWSGSVVHTNGMVVVLIAQDKWDKSKDIVSKILCLILQDPDSLPFKFLESARGFLVYVSRTYICMAPYLKGLHQTLDSWRSWMGKDGWKMDLRSILLIQDEGIADVYQGLDEAPSHVKAAPRLFNDMSALQVLLQGPLPCQRLVRAIGVGSVWYGGG